MANIKINELQPAEFAELSDLELEATVGGKGLRKVIDTVQDVVKVIVPPPQPRPQPRPRPYFRR
jgi:hypothetical protein